MTRNNKLNFLLVLIFLLGICLACNSKADDTQVKSEQKVENKTAQKPEKLESYTLRGLKFSYYKIPTRLTEPELVKTAQEIHETEPDAQLILVDDDSRLKDYINYTQEFSKGNMSAEMPKDWAEKHIVANVQKLMSGKWQLYQGYGYKQIADLK
jgi:hypothetical protein